MNWLQQNLATILISAALLLVLGGIIWSMVRRKRKGESSCGCGCSDCAMNGACHGENPGRRGGVG